MNRQFLLAVVAALTLGVGCSPSSQSSATAPSGFAAASRVTAADFAGAWTSSATTLGAGGAAVPESCSQFDYSVTPAADGRSARLALDATCAGITVTASGQGTMAGESLSWSASGTAVKGSLTCPFSFENSTATLEGSGVRVTYAGTVCGIPVKGSHLLVRRG